MSNTLKISLTEKQLLHAYIDNPDLLLDNEDLFITEIAREYHTVLLILKDKGYSFIPEHILKEKFELIDSDSLQSILETSYQKDKIKEYEQDLIVEAKFNELQNKIVKNIAFELSKKGPKDMESLKNLYQELGETLDIIENKRQKDTPFTFTEMLNEHLPEMKKRVNMIHQPTGCFLMDTLIPNPVAGLCILGGFSGSLKTTFTSYWAKQRLVKRMPTAVVNTELAFDGYVDNFIPSMIKESYADILSLNPDNTDFGIILEKYEKLMGRYSTHNKFFMYPKNSCSIFEIEQFIKYTRKKMNLSNDKLLYVFADLLSMFSDFNESRNMTKADAIENGVNRLNSICLEHNVLLVGTVQFKRPDFAIGRQIEKEEDIEKLRASLSSIKSSGAWVERSRWVLLLHNPFNLVNTYPCNPILKETIDPILEVTLAKDTYMGNNGKTIKYYFNGELKQLIPYLENDTEDTNENLED